MRYLSFMLCFISCGQFLAQANGQETINSNSNIAQPIEIEVKSISKNDTIEKQIEGLRNEQKSKIPEDGRDKAVQKRVQIQSNKVLIPESAGKKTENISDSKSEGKSIEEIEKNTLIISDFNDDAIHQVAEPSLMEDKELDLNSAFDKNQTSTSFYNVKAAASSQSAQRSPTLEQGIQMQNLVNQYKNTAPNSFEYHFYKYLSGNYNVDLIEDLRIASKLNPNSIDVQVQLAAYNFIKNDTKSLIENLKILSENKKIENEILVYAKHLLESVSPNGILLTHGFDDTYSVLYLQNVMNLRKDVKIISLDFMQSDYYESELRKSNFMIPTKNTIDVDFFKSFCELNKSKNLHISMTFPRPYLKAISADISVQGLTMKYDYSEHNFVKSNLDFFESIGNVKEITNFSSEKAKRLSSNYLPFFLSLKKEFEIQGNMEKVLQMETIISKIRLQAGFPDSKRTYK